MGDRKLPHVESPKLSNLESLKNGPKLSRTDLVNIQEMERINFDRATTFLKRRKANTIVGSLLGAGVLGIYFYTMFAVKQETFLDDFEEPEKISE